MISITDAIIALHPNCSFTLIGDDYSSINWIDVPESPATKEQVNDKLQELIAAEPLRLLREERDRRLAATDWRATIDYPGNDQEAWLQYRQALRDITLQDPENVTWPEEPA